MASTHKRQTACRHLLPSMALSFFASPIWWRSVAWPCSMIFCEKKCGSVEAPQCPWMDCPDVQWVHVMFSTLIFRKWHGVSQSGTRVQAYFAPFLVRGFRQLFQPTGLSCFSHVCGDDSLACCPRNMHLSPRDNLLGTQSSLRFFSISAHSTTQKTTQAASKLHPTPKHLSNSRSTSSKGACDTVKHHQHHHSREKLTSLDTPLETKEAAATTWMMRLCIRERTQWPWQSCQYRHGNHTYHIVLSAPDDLQDSIHAVEDEFNLRVVIDLFLRPFCALGHKFGQIFELAQHLSMFEG